MSTTTSHGPCAASSSRSSGRSRSPRISRAPGTPGECPRVNVVTSHPRRSASDTIARPTNQVPPSTSIFTASILPNPQRDEAPAAVLARKRPTYDDRGVSARHVPRVGVAGAAELVDGTADGHFGEPVRSGVGLPQVQLVHGEQRLGTAGAQPRYGPRWSVPPGHGPRSAARWPP